MRQTVAGVINVEQKMRLTNEQKRAYLLKTHQRLMVPLKGVLIVSYLKNSQSSHHPKGGVEDFKHIVNIAQEVEGRHLINLKNTLQKIERSRFLYLSTDFVNSTENKT